MITLTTDFGDSPHAGAMRGAILTIDPEAVLVDITHAVPPHDVVSGAFALFSAVPFFPRGSVHVAVVDPGVGTERKGIAIQAGGQVLIGPDNGILMPAADRLGIEGIVALTEGKYFQEDVSRTFHGRDVFGPVAAHVRLGVPVVDLGDELDIDDVVPLDFGEPFVKDGRWRSRVINVDNFGNVTVNLPGTHVLDEADFGASVVVELDDERLEVELHQTYGQAPEGVPFLTIGSAGYAELAMKEDDCADAYGLDVGDEIWVQFLPVSDPRFAKPDDDE